MPSRNLGDQDSALCVITITIGFLKLYHGSPCTFPMLPQTCQIQVHCAIHRRFRWDPSWQACYYSYEWFVNLAAVCERAFNKFSLWGAPFKEVEDVQHHVVLRVQRKPRLLALQRDICKFRITPHSSEAQTRNLQSQSCWQPNAGTIQQCKSFVNVLEHEQHCEVAIIILQLHLPFRLHQLPL